MVNKEEAKEILLSNNPEYKILYTEDEIDEIVDGICKDVEKVRKFIKELFEMIDEIEQIDPKFAKILRDYFYNLDED
jgi:SMC interacting uncharacterized protein involved in chromosome segregation